MIIINKNNVLNHHYLKKINLKYQLTLRGKDLLDNGDYLEAVVFFKQLLNHELFVNDYHPYTKLANAYHHLKDYDCVSVYHNSKIVDYEYKKFVEPVVNIVDRFKELIKGFDS